MAKINKFKNQRKCSILSNKVFETKKSLQRILSVQELKIPDILRISGGNSQSD